jgi:hypothetical protein
MEGIPPFHLKTFSLRTEPDMEEDNSGRPASAQLHRA